MDRRTFLAGLGSLAVGSGAILDASAVTTVGADRSADVQTAADPSALLGLDGVDDAGTTPTFTNNSDGTMVVELSASGARFDVGDTGSFQNETATFELGAGVTRQVVIDGDSGPVPVSVDAEIEDDDGTVVGSISLQRNYAADTDSDIVVEEGGKVEDDITTSGSVTVGSGGRVEGDVTASGNVSVGPGGRIVGDVIASGSVTVESGGRIEGDVTASGGVTVEPGGKIGGDVIESGTQ